jgi:hypothetical protein
MPNNRIDAVLTPEDIEVVLGAINTIRQRMPFLVDLSTAERRHLPKMGDKTRAFVSKALEIATQTPDLLSAALLAQLRRDAELTVTLQPVLMALIRLTELVGDSYLLVGSEAYSGALTVYELVKRTGQGEALDVLGDELGRRFVKTPRRSESPEPAG